MAVLADLDSGDLTNGGMHAVVVVPALCQHRLRLPNPTNRRTDARTMPAAGNRADYRGPNVDLDGIRAAGAGLDNAVWSSPSHYCLLIDDSERAVPREQPLPMK